MDVKSNSLGGNFTISENKAGADFDRSHSAETIEETKHVQMGRKTTRINFSSGKIGSVQKSADVYVEKSALRQTVISLVAKHKYVEIDRQLIDGKRGKLLINIESLSKRLGISKQEIQAASDQDKNSGNDNAIFNLITNAHAKYQAAEEIRGKLSEKFEQRSQDGGVRNALDPVLLKKIFYVASLAMSESGQEHFKRDLDKTKEKHVYISLDANEEMNIYLVHQSQLIGAGSFGKVVAGNDMISSDAIVKKEAYESPLLIKHMFQSQVDNLSDENQQKIQELSLEPMVFSRWLKGLFNEKYTKEELFASGASREQIDFIIKTYDQFMKEAVDAVREKALNEIRNEYAILKDLHKDGIVPGLQLPPHIVIYNEKSEIVGYFMVRYAGSLEKVTKGEITLEKKQKIEGVRGLLAVVKHMAEKGYVHGDIKPENCLIKPSASGEIDIHLGDLGGAKKLENAEDWGVYTPLFSSNQDVKAFHDNKARLRDINKVLEGDSLDETARNALNLEKEKLRQEQREIELARDVYALGMTIAELFGAKVGRDLVMNKSNLPPAIATFVDKLTDPDYKKRLPIAEALAQFEILVASKAI